MDKKYTVYLVLLALMLFLLYHTTLCTYAAESDSGFNGPFTIPVTYSFKSGDNGMYEGQWQASITIDDTVSGFVPVFGYVQGDFYGGIGGMYRRNGQVTFTYFNNYMVNASSYAQNGITVFPVTRLSGSFTSGLPSSLQCDLPYVWYDGKNLKIGNEFFNAQDYEAAYGYFFESLNMSQAPVIDYIRLYEEEGIKSALYCVYTVDGSPDVLEVSDTVYFLDSKGNEQSVVIKSLDFNSSEISSLRDTPLVTYRNGSVYRSDLFFYNISEVLIRNGYDADCTVTAIDIVSKYKYGDEYSAESVYRYDLVSGSFVGEDSSGVLPDVTISADSGGVVGTFNPNESIPKGANSLLAWIADTLEDFSNSVLRILNSLKSFLVASVSFFGFIGNVLGELLTTPLTYIITAGFGVAVFGRIFGR